MVRLTQAKLFEKEMSYTEEDYKKMARDPKFMADRWQQRYAVNRAELDKRWNDLTEKEREKKLFQLGKMKETAEEYKAKIK